MQSCPKVEKPLDAAAPRVDPRCKPVDVGTVRPRSALRPTQMAQQCLYGPGAAALGGSYVDAGAFL